MRRREVVVTQHAADDLSSAVRYIAKTLLNPQAAEKLLDEFDAMTARLTNEAESYAFVRDEVARASGYRWAEFGNYMAFFRIEEAANRVVIDRVSYNKRDWAKFLVK